MLPLLGQPARLEVGVELCGARLGVLKGLHAGVGFAVKGHLAAMIPSLVFAVDPVDIVLPHHGAHLPVQLLLLLRRPRKEVRHELQELPIDELRRVQELEERLPALRAVRLIPEHAGIGILGGVLGVDMGKDARFAMPFFLELLGKVGRK